MIGSCASCGSRKDVRLVRVWVLTDERWSGRPFETTLCGSCCVLPGLGRVVFPKVRGIRSGA